MTMGPYGWEGGGMGSAGKLISGVVMVVLWGAVIAAVIAFMRATHHHHDAESRAGNSPDDALRTLEVRFARGEIEAGEYTQRRDLLRTR